MKRRRPFFKGWGVHKGQTVSCHKGAHIMTVKDGRGREIVVNRGEVVSLLVALLEVVDRSR